MNDEKQSLLRALWLINFLWRYDDEFTQHNFAAMTCAPDHFRCGHAVNCTLDIGNGAPSSTKYPASPLLNQYQTVILSRCPP